MTGPKLLRSWRQSLGINQGRAAELLLIDGPTCSAYELGKRTPSLAVAVRIEDATDGIVPARSWV